MQRMLFILLAVIAVIAVCFSGVSASSACETLEELEASEGDVDTSRLLPEDFQVHVSEHGVVNWPAPGTEPRTLPTVNATYAGADGCYIACYAHAPGVYNVGGTIEVHGQLRVQGAYAGRVCQPAGAEERDISAMQAFKDLCNANISSCGEAGCWAGGDTGGWYGVQSVSR